MKKLILSFVLILFTLAVFGQGSKAEYTVRKIHFIPKFELALHNPYNWIVLNEVNKSSTALDGYLWHWNDHLYIKLNGVDYQLDQQGGGITTLNTLTGITQTFATGTSGTDFGISSSGTTHTFNIPTASASNRGALSTSDWTTFNNKVATTRTISTTSPLSGGGDLSANRTLAIADAAADGSTKGAASFTSSDFNSSSGNISIDYTNSQASSALSKGFLTSADWTTFNNKVSSTLTISTTSPLTGGGDLSTNRTFAISDAAADATTKGAATFTANDFNSSSGNISLDYTNGQASSSSTKGFLTSADWSTFNGKVGGSGTSGRLTLWSGSGTISSSANATYNSATDELIAGGIELDDNTIKTPSGDLQIDATADISFLKAPKYAPGALSSGPANVNFLTIDPVTLQTEYTTGAAGDAGTYTPTYTLGLNADAAVINDVQYMRVGTVVHVSGTIYVDPTIISTATAVDMSLPVASNFTNAVQATGTAIEWNGTNVGVVISEATNNRVTFSLVPNHTNSRLYYFTYTYQIL